MRPVACREGQLLQGTASAARSLEQCDGAVQRQTGLSGATVGLPSRLLHCELLVSGGLHVRPNKRRGGHIGSGQSKRPVELHGLGVQTRPGATSVAVEAADLRLRPGNERLLRAVDRVKNIHGGTARGGAGKVGCERGGLYAAIEDEGDLADARSHVTLQARPEVADVEVVLDPRAALALVVLALAPQERLELAVDDADVHDVEDGVVRQRVEERYETLHEIQDLGVRVGPQGLQVSQHGQQDHERA